MNWKCAAALMVAGLAALPGCAVHNPNAFRTILEPSCLLAPVVIEDCDVSGDSIHCRTVKLRYRRGCEKIEVVKAKK